VRPPSETPPGAAPDPSATATGTGRRDAGADLRHPAATVTALVLASDPSPAAAERLGRVLDALAAQTRPADTVVAVAAGAGPASLELLRSRGVEPYLRRRSTPAELVRVLPGARPSGRRRPRGSDGRRRPTGSTRGTVAAPGVAAPVAAAPVDVPVPWLWIVTDDVVAAPDALERMLDAVELRPGVAAAGPKVRDLDVPGRLLQAGFTTSRRGTALTRVGVDEVDQGQADDREDVLAVATAGMLLRRDVLDEVGGFDPALPVDGADLDLCRRLRMAGHDVVVVPAAVVERPGRTAADVGGTPGAAAYTRLVSASRAGLPFALVGVLLAGVLRALWRVLVKDPGHAPAELGRVVGVVLRPDRVVAARRRAAAAQVRGRSSLEPLLASRAEVRRHHRDRWSLRRAGADAEAEDAAEGTRRALPLAPGGLPPRRDPVPALVLAAVLLLASALGLRRLLGGGAVQAPALPPAPASAGDLWAAATSSWAAVGTGSPTAPDPLLALLAAAAAVTGGAPGVAVVVLLVLAAPLAALTAWWGAGVLVRGRLLRLAVALVWAAGAPLLVGVATGRLGPVVAHVALPWVARCLVSAYRARSVRRAWAVTGSTALALVVVTAGAPVLGVLALAGVLVLAVTARRRLPLLAAVVPVVAVAGPWAVALVDRAADGAPGQALAALLGGPVPPVLAAEVPSWQQALGQPLDAAAWASVGLGLPADGTLPTWLLVGAPLLTAGVVAALALAAVLLRPRAVVGWVLVVVGLLLALVAVRTAVGVVGAGEVPALATAWGGPGTSLVLLGLLVAAVPLLAGPVGATGPRVPAPDGRAAVRLRHTATALVAVLAALTSGAATAAAAGTDQAAAAAAGLVVRDEGPQLPEVARGSATTAQALRTLVLRPAPETAAATTGDAPSAEVPVAEAAEDAAETGAPPVLGAVLARGDVDLTTLRSLAAAAAVEPGDQPSDEAAAPVAAAAAALVGGDRAARTRLAGLGAGFVVVLPPEGGGTASGTDAATAVDAVAGLERAAEVDGTVLWRVTPAGDAAGGGDLGALRVVGPDGDVAGVVDAAALTGSAPVGAGEEGRRVVLAEQADAGWTATLDGVPLEPTRSGTWAQAFALPAAGGDLAVRHDGGWTSASGPWPWVAGAGLLLAVLLAVPLPGRRTA